VYMLLYNATFVSERANRSHVTEGCACIQPLAAENPDSLAEAGCKRVEWADRLGASCALSGASNPIDWRKNDTAFFFECGRTQRNGNENLAPGSPCRVNTERYYMLHGCPECASRAQMDFAIARNKACRSAPVANCSSVTPSLPCGAQTLRSITRWRDILQVCAC
jgi:hypothetical protein